MEKHVPMAATNEKPKVKNQHITDDVAFSILSKLPLKSLRRFGCCCKSWSLLFENPNFMSMYRNNFISNNYSSNFDDTSVVLLQHLPPFPVAGEFNSALHMLSGERFENRTKLDWPPLFQENAGYIKMLGSSIINGILFLQRGKTIVLWNPAIDEFKVIPPSPVESESLYRDLMITFHGFGYDHVRDDYKVIRRVNFFELIDSDFDRLGVSWEDVSWKDVSFNPLWEIYSLRSNSWKKLDVDMPECVHEMAGFRVYMDGMCHWRGESVPEECLVSFDLSNEVFLTTPMPSDEDEIRACLHSTGYGFDFNIDRHLVVLNGSIALISYYVESTIFHLSILGELGVKESWTKLFTIGPLPCIYYPVGVGKKCDVFFIRQDDELVWFSLRTNMIYDLGVKGKNDCCEIGIYKESFTSIGGINN